MADVRVRHIKTGQEKVLPETVYKQVQSKYKFLGYVDDPNVKIPTQPQVPAAVGVKQEEQELELPNVQEPNTTDAVETEDDLRKRYELTTGKKAGNKKVETLKKELGEN